MVWAADPTVAHEPIPDPLRCGPGAQENTVLGNHPWTREPLWMSRFPVEKSQHTAREKHTHTHKLGHNGKEKRNSLSFPASFLPKGSTAGPREIFSACDFLGGEGEIK